jgi:hypothetical protein
MPSTSPSAEPPEARRRVGPLGGLALAGTGIACPCHVLAGLALGAFVALGGTAPPLSPDLQDAVHGVYVPLAVAGGAALLARARRRSAVSQRAGSRV